MKMSRVTIILTLTILVNFSSSSIIEAANRASNYQRNNNPRIPPPKTRSTPETRDQQFQGYDYPKPTSRNLHQPQQNSKQSHPEIPGTRSQQSQGYDYPEPASRNVYQTQPNSRQSHPETPGTRDQQFQGYDYPEPTSRNVYQPQITRNLDQSYGVPATSRNRDQQQGLLITRGFSSNFGQPIAVFYITPETSFTDHSGSTRSRSLPRFGFNNGYPESRARIAGIPAERIGASRQRGPVARNQNQKPQLARGNGGRFPVIVDSDSVTVISAGETPELPSYPTFPSDNLIGITGTGLLDSYVPSIQGGIPYSYQDCY